MLEDDLRWLVEHESPSDDHALVSALASTIAGRLIRAGASAETVPCGGAGDAVRATFRSRGGKGGTLLVGHLDTVWPVGTLAERPFRIEDGRGTGPGAFDMKAGIAVALAIFDRFGVSAARPPISLFLAPDEEVGSAASREALVSFAREHDRVLVLEPSERGAAKIARKGTGLVRVEFRGRPAHAGLEPEKGASALLEMARFALFLESVAGRAAGTTVTPTLASAGGKTNVVPASAVLTIDARVWTAAEEKRLLAALAAYRPSDPGVAVSIDARFDRPPMEETPASRALYERVRDLARKLGVELGAERVGGASDGNLTAAAGVPTLDGLGPAGGGAHAPDEWVDLEDLAFRVSLLAGFLEQPGETA
ncbi:MAG TPA: M20 family metallopeptidase [Thermoanaerobaculia bacterium]|nr:M20 family metallopeptidase [Thermoanaerobaculia bacterium]